MKKRRADVSRQTNETQISVVVDLDGSGAQEINSGVPFLDHMLCQIARHALVDLTIVAKGDTHIDDHHSVEDVGIVLGQAFRDALGDKKSIARYGFAYVPLDESLSRAVIDISGRPGLYFSCAFTSQKIGNFDTELVREFFQGFVNHAGITLHLDNLKGENAHHQAESLFKAFGRALKMAMAIDSRVKDIPSTKGAL